MVNRVGCYYRCLICPSSHLHVVEGQPAIPRGAVLHAVARRPHWGVLHLSLELSSLYAMMVMMMMMMMKG
jgi:hypothetical protein